MKKRTFFLLCAYLLLVVYTSNAGNPGSSGLAAEAFPVCSLPAPSNLQYVQLNNYTVQFTWDAVPGAAGYRSVLTNLSTGSQSIVAGAPNNATFTVIPGDAYTFTVAAMCSLNPPSTSNERSEISYRAPSIIIELVLNMEGCTPNGSVVGDNNPAPDIWGHDWEYDKLYYINLIKYVMGKNGYEIKEARLAFKRNSEGYIMGELDSNEEPSILCGQSTSGTPGNCAEPPVSAYNSKFTYSGSTIHFAFPSMSELYFFNGTLETPFDVILIYETCEGEHRMEERSASSAEGDFPLQASASNPFSDQLTLYFAAFPDEPVKTRLFDLQGIPKVETLIRPDQLTQHTFSIRTDALPPGMYFLRLETTSGQIVTRKVMKI